MITIRDFDAVARQYMSAEYMTRFEAFLAEHGQDYADGDTSAAQADFEDINLGSEWFNAAAETSR